MMKIKSIVLYNNKGEIRKLDFSVDKANLITGEHDTGKSALIPIINYCLGCADFEIPDGIINNNVAWYGVLYQIGNTQVFIAKPKASYTKEHNTFYLAAERIDIPSFDELKINSSDYHIKKEIFYLIRDSLNKSHIGYNESERLKITLDYTYYYLFQPLKTNVNNEELLYKQRANVTAIKESLPYFIGAKTEAELFLHKQYTEKKTELKAIKNDLEKYQTNIRNNEQKIKDFFSQAQSLNLIENTLITQALDVNQMLEHLKSITSVAINNSSPSELKDAEPELREKLDKLENELNEIKLTINAIQSYNQDIKNYQGEVNEHRMRLQSIQLFTNNSLFADENNCPLCNSKLTQVVPTVSVIQDSLKQLEKNLKFVKRDDIDTSNKKIELEQQMKLKKQEIKEVKNNLANAYKEKKEYKDFIEQEMLKERKIGELIGAVKNEFTKENKPNYDLKKLEEEKKLLEQELETFEVQVNTFKDALNHQLSALNKEISQFSKDIDLSHQGSYLFNLEKIELTVSTGSNKKPISMKTMGGLDIPGCHLITLLALHKFFIKEKSPVPSFLILDQPIQGYSSDNKNNDTDKINKMINLMIDICKEEGLQIILIEHEQNFPMEKEFNRVEEHWTTENALIPKSWI